MIERPILFSGAMVRAILEGRKTQTRRLIGLDTLRPSQTTGYDWTFRGQSPIRSIAQQRRHSGGCWQDVSHARLLELCPYGKCGDQMWLRETWGLHAHHDETDWCRVSVRGVQADSLREQWRLALRADWGSIQDGCHWRPGIFMPRWASRITLEVIDVRVQRLQDISEEDSKAEGVPPFFERYDLIGKDQRICTGELAVDAPYRACFACVWDEINGDRALWSSDPWVWAVTFAVVR